jgi:YD repeat-containing protein
VKFEDQPIGNTFVKGVDVADGHLAVSSTDISVPGIGSPLEFTRSYTSAGSGGQVISSYQYTYDANGNRLQQVEIHSSINGGQPQTTTYGYDALDRLTSVQYGTNGANGSVTYTYDAAGNRLTEKGTDPLNPGQTIDRTYTYNEANELIFIKDQDPTKNVTYDYDLDGNRIDSVVGDPLHASSSVLYSYNVRNELVYAQVFDGTATTTVSYDYDASGQRVKQVTAAGETRYLYDGSNTLLEYDGTSKSTIRKYDIGLGLISLVDFNGSSPSLQFYLIDGLGSVSETTDNAGNVQSALEYDAWGQVRATYGSSSNPKEFTSQDVTPVPGLHYFAARFYDATTGTFLPFLVAWRGRRGADPVELCFSSLSEP